MECRYSVDNTDRIYMIVFRGQMAAPFTSNVNIVGSSNWDDFNGGETADKDISVAGFDADSVYVVMLMEQDSGKDMSDQGDLARIRNLTSGNWMLTRATQMQAGLPPTEPQRTAAAREVANSLAMAHFLISIGDDPDDEIGSAKRVVPGNPPSEFLGEGGRYWVKFKVQ